MKIHVAGITFGSKKALRDHVRRILHRPRAAQWLDPSELEFLKSLLLLHPEAVRKIGCGVEGIWVGPNEFKQPTFFLKRTDGTTTDFSYLSCITPPSEIDDFKKACRRAIDPQVYAFKLAAFDGRLHVQCPILNRLVVFTEAHVDHEPPSTFEFLVGSFFQGPTPEVEGGKDGSMTYRLVDRELEAEWIRWHQANARLRVVSAEANLSHIRKEANKR